MATVLPQYSVDFWTLGSLPLGVGLEMALGGFKWKPGPNRPISRLVELAEGGLRVASGRAGGGPRAERLAGDVLVVVVVGLVAGLAWPAVELADGLGGPASLVVRSILIACGLSFRRKGDEILQAAEATDLASARLAASEFAGSASTRMDFAAIRRAGVLAIGRRANRQAIAPLTWLAIAGPVGLWSYQAIVTLRRMVVEGRPRHEDFGSPSARLDRLVNFLPERLTWLLIALSAALLGEDGGEALRRGRAEGRRQPKQDGAWGMAALLAALGPNVSGTIGPGDVRRALRIARVAALHALALAFAYRVVIMGR